VVEHDRQHGERAQGLDVAAVGRGRRHRTSTLPRLRRAGALAVTALALAPAGAQARTVLVVGDSLAAGLRPHLGTLLPADELVWDARSGRTTPQGLERLRRALPRARPDVVVVSLGTNDGSDPARFDDRIARVLAAVPQDACVVWPDLHRPPRKGAFAGLNRVLRRHAAADVRVRLVRWREAVVRGRVVLPDGLHPDDAGYATRARMVAAAVGRCGSAA
jgi:lysophospholipase L1-like esterase